MEADGPDRSQPTRAHLESVVARYATDPISATDKFQWSTVLPAWVLDVASLEEIEAMFRGIMDTCPGLVEVKIIGEWDFNKHEEIILGLIKLRERKPPPEHEPNEWQLLALARQLDRASPNACLHCGRDKQGHAHRWVPEVKWHSWVEPDDATRLARMRSRRLRRLAGE